MTIRKIGGEENVWCVQIWNFVDVHGNIFNEYLSSVVARLSREDEEYKALQEKIEGIYEEYPKVLAVFDSETESELTEKECAALIEVMELKNKLTDMEMQAIYFRGCYDSVGYLKKQGFYDGLTEERRRWREADAVFYIAER